MRTGRFVISVALIAICAGLLLHGTSVLNVTTGKWTPAASMSVAREGAASVVRNNGTLLFSGGDAAGTVEAFDGASFSRVASLWNARSYHTATVLKDGRVLVAGGVDGGGNALGTAEVYDPTAAAWTRVNMIATRAQHTATLLNDGAVLVAGGDATGTMEIFSPASNSFSAAAVTLTAARKYHAATLLADGRVLIAGGTANATTPLASTDIYDPVAHSVVAGPALGSARFKHTATTALDGNVVVAGGKGLVNGALADLASTEMADIARATGFVASGALTVPRSGHQAFLLPYNNQILLVGGTAGTAADLFVPWTGSVKATAPLSAARPGLAGTALQQLGALLVAGGTGLNTAETYGFATIKSDLLDYPPFSTVTLSGGGWQPGEMVFITVHEVAVPAGDPDMDVTWQVQADANGNFSTTKYVTDLGDVGITMIATATGAVSQAQTSFTDAQPAQVTVTASPAGALTGTFSITRVQQNGNTQTSGGTTTQSFAVQPNSSFSVTNIQHAVNGYNYIGTATVTGTAGDGGTTTTVTLQYQAVDSTAPVVTVPANMTVEATSSSGALVTYSTSANDNVDGAITPTCSSASGSTFPLGTTTVTCSATDAHGNTGSASFNVIVQDTTAPTVTVPSNITAEATSASGAAVTYAAATATDIVDGSLTATCAPASGSTFPLGTTTVTCSATDAHHNTGTTSFTITVRDTTPPVLALPADQTAEATSGTGAAVSFTATANDAVDGAVTPVCAPASGSTFALGSTTVTCSATDAHGNTGSGTFTVTVQDTTPPVVTLPGNITGVEAASAAGAVVTYTASASDLVDGSVTPVCAPASGSTFALGTTTVSCTATDAHHNASLPKLFTITVVDTTPPAITVPADMMVEATGPTGASVTYSATANDLVDGAVTPTCTPASGSTFALTTTTVTCSATDAHGNSATRTFSVTVRDTTPPAITVPADTTAEATGPSGAAVTYSASAVDLVDGAVTPSCTPASGSTFGLTTSTVTCTATDAHGNSSAKSFKVTVQDTTPPAVTPPANMTAEASGPSGAVVTYSGASATDIVDGNVPVSCLPASGSTFALGTATVTCSATDAHHNTGSATFTVTVRDTTPPVITLPGNIAGVEATGPGGAAVTYIATASDLVDGAVTPVCVPVSGSTFPLGTTTVNCSATDSHGNGATRSFTVTVHDTTAPAITLGQPADRATYLRNEPVLAAYSCYDTVSGSNVVYNGTVLPGSNIDTSTVGTKTFVASCSDQAGNLTAKTITYYVQASAAIQVVAALHTVDSKGGTTKAPQALNLKVFDLAKVGSPDPKDFCTIWGQSAASCPATSSAPAGTPLAFPAVYISGPVVGKNGNGQADIYTVLVPAAGDSATAYGVSGSYLVIGQANVTTSTTPPVSYTVYVGSPTDLLASDSTTQKYLQVVQNSAGKVLPAKTTPVPGSLLLIAEPEYLEYTDSTELLPVIYEAVDGDWSITASADPPEGFIATPGAIPTDVATTTTQAVEFNVKDVGSDWSYTTITHHIRHNGKSITITHKTRMINKQDKDKKK